MGCVAPTARKLRLYFPVAHADQRSRPASCMVFWMGESRYSRTVRLPRLISAETCMPGLSWYFASSRSRYGAFSDTIVRKPFCTGLSPLGLFLSDFVGAFMQLAKPDPDFPNQFDSDSSGFMCNSEFKTSIFSAFDYINVQ